MRLKDTSVTVVGLAKSGVSAALLLRREGARVTATDAKSASDLGDAARRLEEAGVRLFLGGHPDEAVDGAALVVTSPGVPEGAKPLSQARAKGIEVIGELELAWRLLPKGMQVVAITGSNGKSTTTSLAGHLLGASGPVWTGGNLGTPLSELLLQDSGPPSVAVPAPVGLPAGGAPAPRTPGPMPRWLVVEVSSFMLETAPTFAPRIAAILNVSPNHLDRHPSLAEYAAIKARIWKNAGADGWTVFNRDDPAVAALAAKAPGRKISFGRGAAPDAGGAGFAWTPRSAQVSMRIPGEPHRFRDRMGPQLEGEPHGASAEVYELDAFPAPGEHNAANAAAAILIARLAGAAPASIQEALATFRPLEHRLEKCGEKNGIAFYNDSKATTSEALAKSISVFEKSIVIAGGKDKGGDFAALRDLVKTRVKKLVTFGTAKDLIADALEGATKVVRTPDLMAAFGEATRELVPGDVVLFSPACASYDQFSNFEERGRRFKALVKEWVA